MTPPEQHYLRDQAAVAGSSAYYALLFLPAPRREAVTALRGFCREVGGVARTVHDPGVAAAKLAWWRAEVAQAFAGQARHPALQLLMRHRADCAIEQGPLQQIIDAGQMELAQTRYLDFAALRRHAELAAGAAGELAARLLGQRDERTTAYARALGIALQLTRVIRDVGEDARHGRIYLPIDELQRFDVKAHEILSGRHSARFAALMRFQTERAQRHFDEALALLPGGDRRAQKPGRILAEIQRTLLREIERDGFQVLDRRTRLTPLRKLWLAWRVQALG